MAEVLLSHTNDNVSFLIEVMNENMLSPRKGWMNWHKQLLVGFAEFDVLPRHKVKSRAIGHKQAQT